MCDDLISVGILDCMEKNMAKLKGKSGASASQMSTKCINSRARRTDSIRCLVKSHLRAELWFLFQS